MAVKNILVYYTSRMFCLHSEQEEVSPDEVAKGHFSLPIHLFSLRAPEIRLITAHLGRTPYDQVIEELGRAHYDQVFLESALRLWNDPSQIRLALFSGVLHCLLLQEHVHIYLEQNSTGVRELAACTSPWGRRDRRENKCVEDINSTAVTALLTGVQIL